MEKTIWIVDDVEEIVFCFSSALAECTNFRIVFVRDAREVKAKSGDIVFLDLKGTNSNHLATEEGVRVFKMTGGFEEADLYKPFKSADVIKLVYGKPANSLRKAS